MDLRPNPGKTMSSDFQVTFYGCRGSIPVSGKEFIRYGGATTCVVISVDGRDIILDAGSGIIQYGKTLARRSDPQSKTSYLFITHTHFDHLMGLPFFSPIFSKSQSIHLFGPRTPGFSSFQHCLESLIRSPYYPVELHEMASNKQFYDFAQTDVVYFLKDSLVPIRVSSPDTNPPADNDVLCEVHCLRGLNHPKCGISIYKVIYDGRSVVFATDTEGYVLGDQRLIQFAQNTDVLIHDAMYTNERYAASSNPTQGYGHSSVQIATEIASDCNAKRLILFHHAPGNTDEVLDDIAALGKSLFPQSDMAYEGMCISV